MHRKILIASVILMGGILLLASCGSPSPTPVIQEVTREVTREVLVTQAAAETTPAAPALSVPFAEEWAASPHADKSAQAFRHWDSANPAAVPAACARCHSETGYLDYIGADGSAPNKVDASTVPTGTVVTCKTCHNDVANAMTSVVFPSGVELTGLGPEARCMQCHQGRAFGGSVDDAIKKANLTDDDTVSKDLGFTNIHYFAAAATLYGTQVKGGYEYPGKRYDAKFQHVQGLNTCLGCHNQHTLKIRVDTCQQCHTNVKTQDDLKNIRMQGSVLDYNGNGDVKEGIYYEITGLQQMLLQAMQSYATEVTKTPIAYDPATYPYFFKDTNGDGKASPDETKSDNGYASWTGRLAKAAYNYQLSVKDPGMFAHNGKYVIELLYDSIDNLNQKISKKVDLSKANRIDAGHFASSEEPFRHWDSTGEVPAGCAKCHSAMGLATFIKDGANISVPPASGFMCANCHDDLTKFTRRQVDQVKFPSGFTVTFGKGNDSNLCISCHQGRESTVSMNALMKGLKPDDKSDKLRFLNVHYFAAGATLFGTQAKGAYEYDGQTYLGRNLHGGTDKQPDAGGPTTCVQCHTTHGLQVQTQVCVACHKNVQGQADLKNIRAATDTTDWDGDGDTTEGMAGEVATMHDKLYAAIQAYAKDKNKAPIVYDANTYPYFFLADDSGNVVKDSKGNPTGYNAWTPRLLKAAYNYQYVQKDPGTFAHNGKYIVQIMYDSIKDVGGDVKGMTRP